MEWVSGNILIRPMCFTEAGSIHDGHVHNFDHTTIFHVGEFTIKAKLPDGRLIEEDIVAPDHRLIRKDVEHQIIAKTPGAIAWCVYAHRTPQGDVVQDNTGWRNAYV